MFKLLRRSSPFYYSNIIFFPKNNYSLYYSKDGAFWFDESTTYFGLTDHFKKHEEIKVNNFGGKYTPVKSHYFLIDKTFIEKDQVIGQLIYQKDDTDVKTIPLYSPITGSITEKNKMVELLSEPLEIFRWIYKIEPNEKIWEKEKEDLLDYHSFMSEIQSFH
jgi:hypothetical protein